MALNFICFLNYTYVSRVLESVKEFSVLYLNFATDLPIKLPRNLLLNKLKLLGKGGNILRLIILFLSNRKLFVKKISPECNQQSPAGVNFLPNNLPVVGKYFAQIKAQHQKIGLSRRL